MERWLTHESHSFEFVKNPENLFHILVKHAGKEGVPIEIFEPKNQPVVIVVGSKVVMKNNQIARYLGFSTGEKERVEKKKAGRRSEADPDGEEGRRGNQAHRGG